MTLPTVAIRVDSGHEIGAGHVHRCLSLATYLRKNCFSPLFICRHIVGNISDVVRQAGYEVILLPENKSLSFSVFSEEASADSFNKMIQDAEESAASFTQKYPGVQVAWVVTDHMHIREPWQKLFATKMSCKVLAIDGQANSTHYADVLLDPQLDEAPVKKWAGFLPKNCILFSGPSCLPFSPNFECARNNAVVRTGSLTRVLVCFGGTDAKDIVCRSVRTLLAWIKRTSRMQIEVDVVVPSNLYSLGVLEELLENEQRCHLHVDLNDLSALMLTASIAIGGGGIMLWERCFLGLPSIVVPLAQNQEKPIARLEREGAVVSLMSLGQEYESRLLEALSELMRNPKILRSMSKNSFKIMSDWPSTEGWLKIMKGSLNE